MTNNKSKQERLVQKFSYFVPDKFIITDLMKNDRANGQKIGYIKYPNSKGQTVQPVLQTAMIKMRSYGIPRLTDESAKWFDTVYKRSFVKIPLNNDDEASEQEKDFYKCMKKWDEYFGSEEFKKKIFPTENVRKKYKYQKIVRIPVDYDSDEDNKKDKKQYYRPDYIKARLKVEYETNDILTDVFLKSGKKRIVHKVKTLEDTEEKIKFGNDIRFILMPCKLWAATTKAQNSNYKMYGIGFKILQVEVTENQLPGGVNELKGKDNFIDSDNDDDDDYDDDDDDDEEKDDKKLDKTHELEDDSLSSSDDED